MGAMFHSSKSIERNSESIQFRSRIFPGVVCSTHERIKFFKNPGISRKSGYIFPVFRVQEFPETSWALSMVPGN